MEERKDADNSEEVDTAAALLAFRGSQQPGPVPCKPNAEFAIQKQLAVDSATETKQSTDDASSKRSCNDAQAGMTDAATVNLSQSTQNSNAAALAAASQLLSKAAGLTAARNMILESQQQQAAMNQAVASSLQLGQLASFNGFANVLSPFLLPHSQPSVAAAGRPGDAAQAVAKAHHQDIRQEEVEKALRSKPQRGRKRSNLNHDERQELARTRNREHAKSTRMRKKQRLQELLEIEAKYIEAGQREQLNESRLAAARELLRYRQSNHFSRSSDVETKTAESPMKTDDNTGKFESLVSYSYLVNLSPVAQGDHKTMKEVDDALLDQALQRLGKEVQIDIRYSDLALCPEANSAVMSVYFRAPVNDVLLRSTLTKVVFAPDSDSVVAVQETRLHEFTTSDNAVLQTQVSYPSVISLDEKGSQSIRKDTPSEHVDTNAGGLFI